MTITITRTNLAKLFNAINELAFTDLKGFKFFYALNKTKNLIDPEIQAIISSENKKNETVVGILKDFNDARIALCKAESDKDANGEPIVANATFVLSEEAKLKVSKEVEALKVTFADAFATAQVEEEKFAAFLNETINIEVSTIKADIVPDALPGHFVEKLMPVMED